MKCSFCSKDIVQGRGKMYVKNDGTVYYFDSSKCEKNFLMGRKSKKMKWTKEKKK
jgi:large subunit ribosomal protein L24e